jgi:hypothetical protein
VGVGNKWSLYVLQRLSCLDPSHRRDENEGNSSNRVSCSVESINSLIPLQLVIRPSFSITTLLLISSLFTIFYYFNMALILPFYHSRHILKCYCDFVHTEDSIPANVVVRADVIYI